MRSERGEFSLVGLLVAVSIFGFVLSATYAAFDVFNRNARDSQVRNEATDRARFTTDAMARQLRNLATPTALQPDAVKLASPYDIVFETVAPTGTPPVSNPQNIEFVRYCLDGALRLWVMELPPASISASTVPPTAGGCPGGGWSNTHVVAQSIVNTYNGQQRPVFSFDSTQNDNIRRVRIDLFVDTDPGKGPVEQEVTTGVGLRNQDRKPVAKFPSPAVSGGTALLDGTTSTDPDNDPLTYCWYDSTASTTVGACGTGSISDAPYFRYKPANPTAARTITLTVTDPSGLSSSASLNLSALQ